ncbi:MAG TPA: hypothetical protein VNT53_00020 [Pseudolysinimonas sp.]|nr:hypothetical protein [Pseudolysinimonas sp.]
MSGELWESVQALAEAWQAEEAVQRVLAQMPSRHAPPRTGIAERVEMMQAGGVPCRPLWMGGMYELASQLYDNAPTPAGINEWLSDAYAVQAAYLTQLGWVRAQLPGYPMLRLPQLVAGAPLVSSDITRGLPWFRQHFGAGFQTMPKPPPALSANAQLRDATVRLVSHLQQTAAWDAFMVAQARLGITDLEQLRAANSKLRLEVRDEAVHHFEPVNFARRQEFRSSKLRDATDSLTGKAHVYAVAFDIVNDLFADALDYGLNHLVEFDHVEEITGIDDIDIDGNRVAFTGADVLLRTRSLVYLPDAAINEGGVVTMTSFAFEHGEMRTRVEVELLPGLREGLQL